MIYEYKCINKKCKNYNKVKLITKSIKNSSKEEYCESCNIVMQRVFSNLSIKTNDNFKR